MARIFPHALDEVQDAYDTFMRAPLGELNTTRERLEEAARRGGWDPMAGGLLVWVRTFLASRA